METGHLRHGRERVQRVDVRGAGGPARGGPARLLHQLQAAVQGAAFAPSMGEGGGRSWSLCPIGGTMNQFKFCKILLTNI